MNTFISSQIQYSTTEFALWNDLTSHRFFSLKPLRRKKHQILCSVYGLSHFIQGFLIILHFNCFAAFENQNHGKKTKRTWRQFDRRPTLIFYFLIQYQLTLFRNMFHLLFFNRNFIYLPAHVFTVRWKSNLILLSRWLFQHQCNALVSPFEFHQKLVWLARWFRLQLTPRELQLNLIITQIEFV